MRAGFEGERRNRRAGVHAGARIRYIKNDGLVFETQILDRNNSEKDGYSGGSLDAVSRFRRDDLRQNPAGALDGGSAKRLSFSVVGSGAH